MFRSYNIVLTLAPALRPPFTFERNWNKLGGRSRHYRGCARRSFGQHFDCSWRHRAIILSCL